MRQDLQALRCLTGGSSRPVRRSTYNAKQGSYILRFSGVSRSDCKPRGGGASSSRLASWVVWLWNSVVVSFSHCHHMQGSTLSIQSFVGSVRGIPSVTTRSYWKPQAVATTKELAAPAVDLRPWLCGVKISLCNKNRRIYKEKGNNDSQTQRQCAVLGQLLCHEDTGHKSLEDHCPFIWALFKSKATLCCHGDATYWFWQTLRARQTYTI